MTPNAPVASPNKVSGKRPLVPPDEQFWQRYSPHHEAPLSGVSSAVTHGLLALLIVGGFALAQALDLDKDDPPVPVDVAMWDIGPGGGNVSGGGGAHPGGAGDNPGVGDPNEPREESGGGGERPNEQPPPDTRVALSPAERQGILEEFPNDDTAKYYLQKGTQQAEDFFRQADAVRDQLRQASRPGKGRGGEGSGGGRGGGTGDGTGDRAGPGKGTITQREKRMLRWNLRFQTRNGGDYASQLHAFGAILVFQVADDPPRFLVVRDVKNPEAAKEEDISGINRIFWTDADPRSVRQLCRALRLPQVPQFHAFFPETFEKDLLAKEKAAMQRDHGRWDENAIHETKFDVVRQGNSYDIRVRDVVLKR